MKLIKDYMKNDILRHELNVLTEKTFGFNFENWVTQGYFQGDYIPYSFEENGEIISNVSANIMRFEQNGKTRNYIQIGTVMTDVNYRKQGLASKLMEFVLNEYKGKCDGFYLFGDLDALDFYRKSGFYEKVQYLYTLKSNVELQVTYEHEYFKPVASDNEVLKKRYLNYVKNSVPCGSFEQINKYGLQMFYTADADNIYYSETLDCFIVMEIYNKQIELQSVLSQKEISLSQVISRINLEYTDLKLGFTPSEPDLHLFNTSVYDGGDDYRLFCYGEKLDTIEKEKLYFPTLSHA